MCLLASTVVCDPVTKILLMKENGCLIQCSITLRIQVDSYQWIWSDTFQEHQLHQKTSIGHCHSNTAFWTKAGGADCCSAHSSGKRSSIQDAHLPREKNGYIIISSMMNVILTKKTGPIFLLWLHDQWYSIFNIKKEKENQRQKPTKIWIKFGLRGIQHRWNTSCVKAKVKCGSNELEEEKQNGNGYSVYKICRASNEKFQCQLYS